MFFWVLTSRQASSFAFSPKFLPCVQKSQIIDYGDLLMANQEHLKILNQGVDTWNRWRKQNIDVIPKLRGANFRRSNFRRVNFSRADLSGANFIDANLTRATLHEANLKNANLRRVNFRSTKLTNANLRDVHLYETIFVNVDLSKTKNLELCNHHGPSSIDHRTLVKSGRLPETFLRGCGLPEGIIKNYPSLFDKSPLQFYSCFISYSHEDKFFARRIHDTLQDQGIRCWLDEKQVLPGDKIHKIIDSAINIWDKVLLCCSNHSLNSWWVDNEIETAFTKERFIRKERGEEVLAFNPT